MAAQVTNLSLLSRGVGEVQIGNHEKIEVKLEPEDYNNWLDDARRVWNVPAVLPPIQQSMHVPQFHQPRDDGDTSQNMTDSDTHRSKNYPAVSHDSALSKVYLPKTFTTRKGALLLFSEDFANKQQSGSHQQAVEKQSGGNVPELRTVDDLAKSILAYGATKSFRYSDEEPQDDVYLGFVHTRSRKYYERQYKPGFSAKRYLSSWSKLWDYSLLNKLTNKGYIKPVPYQKKSDYDVSGIPLPYRILRQWLFAPGSIDGYTFYRQSKAHAAASREPTVVVIEETPRPVSMESEMSQGSIKVTSLLANKELNYGELDSSTKESILTELLVKSAITHAIKKQKEYQETVSKNLEDEEMKRKASAKLYEFDMMNAIQTALDSSIVPTVSTFNLDPHGLISEEQKTKKEKKGFRGTRGFGLQVSTGTSSVGSAGSVRSSFETKHKVLPPIPREEQRISKPLTIGGQIPAIPAHYNAPPSTVAADEEEEYTSWRESVLTSEKRLAAVAEGSNTSVPSKQKSVSKVSLDSDVVELEQQLSVDSVAAAADSVSTNNQLNLTSNNSNAASEAVIDVRVEEKLKGELSAAKQTDRDSVLSNSKASSSSLDQPAKKSALSFSGHFSSALEALSLSSPAGVSKSPSSKASSTGAQLDISAGQHSSSKTKAQVSKTQVNSDSDSAVVSDFNFKLIGQHLSSSLNDLTAIDDAFAVTDLDRPKTYPYVAVSPRVTSSLLAARAAEIKPIRVEPEPSAMEPVQSVVMKSSAQSRSIVSSIDLLSQVGLDNDHDLDDKKSVISTMSMLSMNSKRSKFSSTGYDAPYTKGITSRQDPSTSLLKVDMIASESDPTAAITSWRYQVEQEEPYVTHVVEEERGGEEEEAVESKLDTTPVPQEVEETASCVSQPAIPASPTPDSVPAASDHCTPTPVPSSLPSTKPPTPQEVEEPEEITETEFMEALTEQAREIAKAVLEQNPDAGVDLAVDAKNAAELLMNNLPDGQETVTSTRAPSQSADVAEDSVEEPPSEDTLASADGAESEGFAATVGELVKEGLESLVNKIDEYVQGDASVAGRSSAQTPSIASATPSVPGTHAHTPSIKSSRLSSAQLEAAASLRSAAESEMDDYAHSIPNADGLTPSESRATKLSAGRLSTAAGISSVDSPQGTSRAGSTSLSKFMTQRSSATGDVNADEAEAEIAAVPGSAESRKSQSKKSSSASTPKKSDSKVQHETEFVVGKVADKTELQQLYAPVDPPSPAKSKTKGGKAKPIVPKPSPPKKEPVKKVEKAATKKPAKKAGSRKEKKGKQSNTPGKASVASAPEKTPEPEVEPDIEFVIVRDEFSDEEEEEQKPQLGSVKSLKFATESPEASVGTDESTGDEEDSLPPGLSNRDAQAAKRAAAKEKRRRDMERRRKEREEALRKEREDAERKERIRLQMEEERSRREEELRLKKEMEREERERLEREEEARIKAEKDAQERERKRQEEKARILEEKRKRMLEEEERRKALQAQRDAEEADRLRQEQELMAAMAEEERAEYLKRKEEEERLRKIAEEEARIKMEEENRRVMAELQRQEAEKRRAEEILRQRLMFQRSLNVEAHGMDHSQDITRAFVFSYYELLKWLGYEVPEWAQFGPTPSADFIYNNHPTQPDPLGAAETDQAAPDSTSNVGHSEH